MTPKTARNLSAVTFVALFVPCWNLLVWVQILFVSFGRHVPLMSGLPPLASCIMVAFGAFLPSLALYFYLRRRDFPQICADCAARKPLVWTLFLLFAFLSLVHPSVNVTPVMLPSDYTVMSDENFEVYTCDYYFDDPEDAPLSLQPEISNPTPQTPEVSQ